VTSNITISSTTTTFPPSPVLLFKEYFDFNILRVITEYPHDSWRVCYAKMYLLVWWEFFWNLPYKNFLYPFVILCYKVPWTELCVDIFGPGNAILYDLQMKMQYYHGLIVMHWLLTELRIYSHPDSQGCTTFAKNLEVDWKFWMLARWHVTCSIHIAHKY